MLEAPGAAVVTFGRTDDFVPIDTEAVSEEDRRRGRAWAAGTGFDAIVSTDGDADRPLIGDEEGRWLRGDVVGLLTARYLGARTVAAPVSCNTAIEACGQFAQVRRTRIGSPYVTEAMGALLAEGAQGVVGFEANGGFLLGSPVVSGKRRLAPLPTRDALLPILSLLDMARARGERLSDLARALPARHTASDRLPACPAEAGAQLIARLAADPEQAGALPGYPAGKPVAIDRTDGLRLVFGNGDIVHLRQSGNAPELRCYAESGSPQRAEALARDCLRHVARHL